MDWHSYKCTKLDAAPFYFYPQPEKMQKTNVLDFAENGENFIATVK